MNKRIMIIGCPGSGKSTLAEKISAKTGIPVVHLDSLYWRTGWQHITEDEFNILLQKKVNRDTWIIDGNYDRTIMTRLTRCDTIIYLDLPRWICIYNALKRVMKYAGKTRPDMGTDCFEKIDLEFFVMDLEL